MNLMQRSIDVLLSSEQLRKRDISESVIDNLMKLHNHRPDPAITGMYATVENA